MTIKALEKLRKLLGNNALPGCIDMDWDEIRPFINAIEQEVAERFMELPVDAEGVPIRVGDELETAHGGKVIVEYVGECEVWVYRDSEHYRIFQDEYAYTCHHIKPRTIEDVLCELEGLRGYGNSTYEDVVTRAAELAEELRELMADESR